MAINRDFTLRRHNGTDTDVLYPTTRWAQIEEKPSTFTPTAHTHGNISDDGKIGATSDLVVITTTNGVLTTQSRSGIDSRSAFTPSSHATNGSTYGYGDTTNAGHLRVGEGITVSSGTISNSHLGTPVPISGTGVVNLYPIATYANKTVNISSSSAVTIQIPANSSYAYPVGTQIDFIRTGAGEVTFAITTDSLVSEGSKKKINTQYQAVTLKKIESTTWVLIGALKS